MATGATVLPRPHAESSERAAARPRLHVSSHVLILLGLTVVAILSRLYTTNSLAGEPTSDEYLYAVHARDLARAWAAGHGLSLAALGVEGRSIALEAAVLSFVLPWDALTIGRTVQALLNALCVPMTFILGRQVGLRRSAAIVAAVLLLATPEFQEIAWRFWTDSQATLLCLVYLSALVAFMRRPGWLSAAIAIASLAGLVVTKESAAVTFTPFLVLGAAVPLSRRLTRSSGRAILTVAVLMALVIAGLALLLVMAPDALASNPLLQKTFGAGPLILASVRNAIPRIPAYSEQLTRIFGLRELGLGVLCATLVGYVWLLTQTVVALVSGRRLLSLWVLGWLAAAIVWAFGITLPARSLAALGQSDPWVAVAAAGLLAGIGTVGLRMRSAHPNGWGLALLGLVVLVVLAERLIIVVTPNVSAAALFFRSLMPIVPLYAILAAGGVWAAANAVSLLVPSVRWARPALTILAGVAVVTFWSPLLRDRFSSQPLLGRVADRGADVETPQGLRVEALVEAEAWLKANLEPTDRIITGVPRHLAWYADLGVDGLGTLIDLGSQPRTEEQRRQYILDRVGPSGASYVVDFNVNWLDPGGDAARQWRQTYETLAGRPNLEPVYVRRDRFGNPVFYVFRNHGYALAPR
jgi:hypothetical protein